jgi:LysM repeat protein
VKIYETTEDLKSGNLSSLRTRAVSVARRFVGGLPVFLALTIAAQAQTSGPASYQDRSDAALHRRQLAGMTQDLAALKDLVNKLQFDLQDVQRENQTLRQKVVELQRVQVSTPASTALDTVGMEKILSAMRAQIYKDINKLRGEFFASLDDMQKQMNSALNEVASAPPPSTASSSPGVSSPSTAASLDYEQFYEHVVAKGDTLYGIARQYKEYKVHLTDIKKANKLNDRTVLKVGQKLVLPVRN